MKRKVHWRLLSMLIAICMTMQLLPVIAVHAASHEYFYYGTGLNKAADGEPASIDPASEILIDGGSVSFTDAAQITWKANGLEEPEAPKDEFQYYSVVVSETIDGEDYETEIYFVIYAEHEHEFGDTYEHEYGHELVCNYCAAHINELHSYGEWVYAASNDSYTRTCSVCGHISEGKKVTYDYGQNGGTSSTVEFEIVEEGAPADLTPTAERDGYDFVGWTTNQSGETPDTGVYVQNNITLYAIFSKTRDVNFYSQDNKLQKTFTATMYNNNKYASVEADLGLSENSAYYPADYDGWEVDGWTSSTEANDEVTTSEMIYSNGKLFIPDATVDYYGFYLRDYTLEYDVNSYSDIAAAPDPTWIFQYYNSSGNESSAEAVIASAVVPSSLDYKWVIDGKLYSPGEKITLTTAVEEAKFVLASDIKTVTYDYATNGGTSATASTKQVISGEKADLTPTAVKQDGEGSVFVGWNYYKDAHYANESYTVQDDTTLYAIFKKPVNVEFRSFDGTDWASVDVYNNETGAYIDSLPTPSARSGWTTLGWKDSDAASAGTAELKDAKEQPYIPDVSKAYYGLYSRELTLTYDTTGHYSNNTQTGTQYHNAAGNTSSVSLTVNAPATTTVDPDFLYWTDADGNIYDPSDTINIIEDTTLYASWRSEQNYAVTYDYATNGGTSVDGEAKRLVKYGGAADLTPAAVKADSEFIGWNTDRNAHEALDTYTVTGDITLYAIFARTETVRFYSQPGRIQAMLRAYCFNNESDYYIEGVPAPAVPAGWTALGWTTST